MFYYLNIPGKGVHLHSMKHLGIIIYEKSTQNIQYKNVLLNDIHAIALKVYLMLVIGKIIS